jgi:hypothetical protein
MAAITASSASTAGGQAVGGDAGRVGQGLDRADIVRVHAARQHRLVAAGDPGGHHHRLGGGGGAVIERGVGHFHAGQGRDLGLELEQHLQRALGDLGLVGRVAGQEFRPLDDVVDRGRHMVAIGPRPHEERAFRGRAVAARQGQHLALDLQLAGVERQVHRVLAVRATAGTSTNSSSIDSAPMAPSMSARSSGVRGR